MRNISTLAMVCLLLWSADAGAFTEECPFGVNAHQASDDALDLAAAAGIGWVRFDMNWFQFEPSNNGYDWTVADRFVDHCDELGLHVFMTLGYTPDWATGVACNNADPNDENWCLNKPPANVGDWTDFVTAAVQRYSGSVKHFGMWNEPNLGQFYSGTRDQYVDDILIPGSNAVHAACNDCYVLGPELAHLRGAEWDSCEGVCVPLLDCECAFNGWNHSLSAILAAAGGHIDIVTHHKYGDPYTEWWDEALDGEFIVIQIINGIKEITDQYAPGKPVWITEFGWETEHLGDHTNAYGADQLENYFYAWEQVQTGTFPTSPNQPWPELEKFFWYDLVNDDNAMTFGLLESDLDPKDPYYGYMNVIQALGNCEEGDDDDTGDDDTGDDDTGDDDTGDDDTGDDDTGDDDTGDEDTGGDDDDTGDDDTGSGDDDTGVDDDDDDDGTPPPGNCTCSSRGRFAPVAGLLALLLPGLLLVRRTSR